MFGLITMLENLEPTIENVCFKFTKVIPDPQLLFAINEFKIIPNPTLCHFANFTILAPSGTLTDEEITGLQPVIEKINSIHRLRSSFLRIQNRVLNYPDTESNLIIYNEWVELLEREEISYTYP